MKSFRGTRVYFSPCGIGLGHASRNMPIAQELKRRDAKIIFSTYLEGIDYTEKQGFRVLPSLPISMSNDSSGSIDLKMSSINQGVRVFPTFMRQVNTEIKYMKAFKPNAVISDSRLSSIFAAKLLDIPTLLILNQFTPLMPRVKDMFMFNKVMDGVIMTLIGRGWGYADKILIPDFPTPNTLSIDCLRIPGPYQKKVELIGAILPQKPGEARDRRVVKEEFEVADDQKLIYAAISGPRAERVPLLKILIPIFESFPDEYRIVMSMGDPSGDSKPNKKGSLVKISWIKNKFDLLNACELVISRGGHETMMQTICYGKPAVIIPVPNHPEQYGNARRAQEMGVAHAVHQRNLNKEVLLLLLEEMLSDDSFTARLSKLSSEHIGDGVYRIIRALESILNLSLS